jgi:lipoprotein signal peptidase
MAKNRGAAWGAISRTSPMIVVFSILTAMIIAS